MTSNEEEALSEARKQAIRHRWREILGYGLLAGLINLLLIRLLRDRLVSLTNLASDIGWLMLGIALLALVYAARVPTRQDEAPAPWYGIWRWRALLGLKHLGEYPPLWIASLLGLGLTAVGLVYCAPCLGLDTASSNMADLTLRIHAPKAWFWISLLGTIAILCFEIFCQSIVPRSPETADAPPPSSEPSINRVDLDTFENIEAWLKDDRPITTKDGDRFGFSSLAQAMAGRMRKDPPPSQAVVGAFGSGKSTLGRLVKQELERQPGKPVRLVQVELWPFETPEAAVSGMIRHLLDAMADEIPVIGLSEIPRRYINAMRAKGGWWASASHLLEPTTSSPVETLEELDAVATAIGVRYVLWVDDLERFAAKDSQATADQRLQPIRAFLHGFNERNALSCVTATVELGPFQLDKIARHVIELPEIQAEDTLKILKIFREGCLETFKFLDPNHKARQREHALTIPKQSFNSEYRFDQEIPTDAMALLDLCKVPRSIKQGLRRCLDFWERYTGEIDFDDLLVVSILRESQPVAFAEYRDTYPRLAYTRESSNVFSPERLQEAYKKENIPLSNQTAEAIQGLWNYLKLEKPQGFTSKHGDYWRLYTNEHILHNKDKDQVFLSRIKQCDFNTLVSSYLNNENKLRWIGFNEFIKMQSPEFMQNLLDTWFTHQINRPRAKITQDVNLTNPGIKTLFRIWKAINKTHWCWDSAKSVLQKQIYAISPKDRHLAINLEKAIMEAIADVYLNDGDYIAESFANQPPWTLCNFARRWHSVATENKEQMPSSDFVYAMGKALAANRIAMIPQLAWLCMERKSSIPGDYKFRLDPEYVSYFGISNLKAALQDQRIEDWDNDPVVQAFLREVQALPEEAPAASTSDS